MNLLTRTERWLIYAAVVAFLLAMGCALEAFGGGHVKSEIRKVRDLVRRSATHACRAGVLLEKPQNLDRAINQACLDIVHAEALLQRARILLIRNPELRTDALAALPPEPEL